MRAALVALLLVATLTACGTGEETDTPGAKEADVTLKDGRTVTCLFYKDGYAGGVSCDWATAR